MADLMNRLTPFLPPAGKVSAIQDEQAEHLEKPRGTGAPKTTDLGGGRYTWWTNTPDKDVAAYRPGLTGRYRIWLSWGAGYKTHTTEARYLLKSRKAEQEIARVNQQRHADGSGHVNNTMQWSGLFDAGVHRLEPGDALLLRGGPTGTAITADIVLFQAVTESEPVTPPTLRPPVSAQHNLETFPVRPARFVRFTIEKTNVSQPCIDELEIFSGGKNVALATSGAKASSSGDFVHPLHKLAHINDGLYGNAKSWISAQTTKGWVRIELPEVMPIERIEWARDREGTYKDRLAVDYRIETAVEPGQWTYLASSADRQKPGGKKAETYRFAGHPDEQQGRHWLKELEQARSEKKRLEETTKVYAGTFAQPGPTHRLYRGEPDAKRERVGPGAIRAFTSLELPLDAPERERRLAFADWIADEKNPLTARVIANRIWQFHFGVGIVDTPSDFGTNGTPPSHPQMLDWLALELMDHGWSLKHLHRLILTSQTWRQNNKPIPQARAMDAASRLLWRFPSRRLEAEGIRDSILAASGVLDLRNAGGPGFSPFKVQMENVRHYHPKQSYGPGDWRRMIYMTKVRQEREQVFGAFDCPDASMVVPKRSRSTTPLQALNLFNSHFVLQQADLFGTTKRELNYL
ncbi:MAG: DUF1553 domain-containing protein, partial [Verrucomicrobiota bacterium]